MVSLECLSLPRAKPSEKDPAPKMIEEAAASFIATPPGLKEKLY